MARPIKEGMDYFPHDTNASTDKKIEALRAIHGNDGYAFYFIMLEQIYQEPNFELLISDAETREEMLQILSRKTAVTPEKFNQILNTAIKWGCFDKELYEQKGILTSNGIKKRAGVVLEKRNKMRVKYQQDKEIISDAETTQETKEETPQSKDKVKGKIKEIITTPVEHEFITVLEQIPNYPIDSSKDLTMYRELEKNCKDVDLVAAVKDWKFHKISEPLTSKNNPRGQLNTWCKNAQAWGKNKKQDKSQGGSYEERKQLNGGIEPGITFIR